MIDCRTLGPVEVLRDGGFPPAELLWRKHLALLLYLARSPRRGRSREHLLGLLWSDKPEARARHSLNQAVRVLRRSLGDEAVDTAAGQVRLVEGAVRLDLQRLEAQVAAADWEAAAGLVAGEFLEGFSVPGASEFEEWLAAERSHWRRRGVEVLVRCAEGRLAGGAVGGAEETARRALALDSRSELAARALMRSLALAGERAAAVETYEAFARRLADELGVAPEPETAALAARIRREPRARPAQQGTGRRPELDAQLPLTGRDAELRRLLEAAAACRESGRATCLLLEGDSGTGKSRLLEELLVRQRLDGAVVAVVRAVESDRGQPGSGLRSLARGGLLDARGLASAPVAAVAAFADLPEWAERFPGAVGAAPLPLGRALGELLRAATPEQPIFLAVDDAEWLDRESVLALAAAMRDLAAAPLGLALATAGRAPAPELDALRARIGREVAGLAVVLGPFDAAALRAVAHRLLPRFSEMEIDRVVRRVGTDSAGLPLIAIALLRAVALGMDLGATSGAWPEPLRTLDQTLPGELPDAVVAAIRVDYRRLSSAAQQVLAAASVLDQRVTPELVARGLDLPVEGVTAALDELEWQRWLVSEPRGYAFVARVVRQVIARDMLTRGQRRRILARLAPAP